MPPERPEQAQEQDYSDRHLTSDEVCLVVECARTTQRKYIGIKRDVCAEAGIADYLVVDLQHKQATQYIDLAQGNTSKREASKRV